MHEIDFLTVVVSAIIATAIFILWFSDIVFGKVWKKYKNIKKSNWLYSTICFFLMFISALVLAFVELYFQVTSFWDGVICGIIIWFGFVLPTLIFSTMFGENKIKLILLESMAFLVAYIAIGGILAG
jgi:hypothetical protein